ncbi:hypothetical protein NGC25_13675 [Enterococcus faecalis]|uniref:hypothetical protein n=1 Tax=Enterococcus faecalis TaxID=1351 RepID=UPI001387108F|nr:hypothetical protein [Enterococcus faecalis]MEB7428321.1 hypothetical protein [Enterococcus faecalis]
MNPKVNKKWDMKKLEWLRVKKSGLGFNIETDIYHIKPEEIERYPNALGFDLIKTAKVNG